MGKEVCVCLCVCVCVCTCVLFKVGVEARQQAIAGHDAPPAPCSELTESRTRVLFASAATSGSLICAILSTAFLYLHTRQGKGRNAR